MNVATANTPSYPYGEAWDTLWIRSDNLPAGCPENLLHFRVSQDGRVIGQGNAQTQIAHYYTGSTWIPLGSTIGTNIGAFGPNGTVYVCRAQSVDVFDRDGHLLRTIPGFVGVNGIRWVDAAGNIHSGDATYSGPLGIHQYTDCNGVLIGQGPELGAVVYMGGKLRWLLKDQFLYQFIRTNRVGDTFYIHLAREAKLQAVKIVLELNEIGTLPEVEKPVPPPPPPPPPPPTKPPTKPPVTPPPVTPPPPSVETLPIPVIPKGFLPGVCWPIGEPFFPEFESQHLREIAILGLKLLRFDLHHTNPFWKKYLTQIVNAGLIPLPILRADAAAADQNHERALVVAFVEQLLKAAPWLPALEIENEPSARWNVDDYINLCTVVGQAVKRVNPSTKIIVAAETHDFSSGKEHDFWPKVKKALDPALYDAVAIHPYRNPKLWYFSAWSSREAEFKAIQDAVGDKEIWVTETGWKAQEGAGENVVNDMDYWRFLGAKAVCVYAHVGHGNDFGLFEDTSPWTPRPAAIALAHYFEVAPIETA